MSQYYTPKFHVAFVQACKQAAARYPDEKATLERAALLVLDGAVIHAANGEYIVLSQTTPGKSYVVRSVKGGGCECPAYHKTSHCKHRWAKSLYKRAMEHSR